MIQTVNVNVAAQPTSGGPESFLVLSQNENGRQIRFRILGDDLPAGCTATFSGTKPDGTVYSASGTIDGNFVLLDEEIQMTAVSGRWDAKLSIAKGTENIMTSLIRVTVVADAVSGDSIPSDSELDGIVAECRSYAEAAKNEAYGSPLTASTAAAMTDQSRVYVYTGSESGMTAGHWYYYNGTAWADGGVYNAVAVDTDTTLAIAGKAADAKKVGDELADVKEDLNAVFVVDSASGGVAHFTDGANNIPMKSVKVNIEPIQSGSGDPSPSNVRPITGWDSVKVIRAGKNLIPYPYRSVDGTYQNVTRVTNADGSVTFNGIASANSYFNFVIEVDEFAFKAGSYILSANTVPDDCLISVNVQVNGVNKYNANLTAGNTSVAFTPQEDGLLRCYATIKNGAVVDNWTVYPMLVYGSDAPTEFEPYNGNEYDVSLESAGTVYGGTLDVVSGVLTVDRAFKVFNGSESWEFSSISIRPNINITDMAYKGAVICNMYPYSAISNAIEGTITTNSGLGYNIWIKDSINGNSLANWKAYLAEHPLQVVYMLATPITYNLTPTEVKSLLGINNVWSDAGSVEVDYRADTKLYIDKRLGV